MKGRDERLELAVLEVAGVRDLSAATLGRSDAVRVGAYVLATGNPSGLGHTTTSSRRTRRSTQATAVVPRAERRDRTFASDVHEVHVRTS